MELGHRNGLRSVEQWIFRRADRDKWCVSERQGG